MPFDLNSYGNAKEKANKRLTEWVEDTKHSGQSGITRLQKVHKNLFKRIAWKPKYDQLLLETDSSNQTKPAPCDADGEMRTPFLQSLYLEDHQIHDSNSSNVSSRLQSRKEEIKYSENKTPLPRTPLFKDGVETNDGAEKPQAEFEANRRHSKQLGPQSKLVLPIHFPVRRRRKKHVKKENEADGGLPMFNVIDDQQQHAEVTVGTPKHREPSAGRVAPSQLSIAHSTISMLKKKSSTGFGGMFQPQNAKNTSKGMVDSILKRSIKSHKHSRVQKLETGSASMKEGHVEEMSKEDRRQKVLNRFRKMVRQLIHVRVLLNVSRLRIQEEEKSKEFKRFDGGMELSFDPTMYKQAISYGGLTSRARKALKKNAEDRNEEDARLLMEVMLRMSVFLKYPKSVRQDLARVMWYDNFHNGRVIVKQGDPGTRMYFVVSGEVDLKRTDVLDTGEHNCYHLNTVTAGCTFGELALIRDMKREFTAICKGSSEFLSLSKGEFNQVLRSRWEKECNIRFSFLRSCDNFMTWTDKQLQTCADSSLLKEYPDNTVILGGADCQSENVYIIRKGRCDVVRRILVVRQGSPYLRPHLLLPETANRSRVFMNKLYARNRRILRNEVHFLTVTTLHPGSYFGAGESLRDTFILSRGKTECVIINRAQFSIQGKSAQLLSLTRERENSIPSNKTLYNKFQENRRWYEYRNKLLKDILNRKNTRKASCTMADVPKTIMKEPAIPRDLIYYN